MYLIDQKIKIIFLPGGARLVFIPIDSAQSVTVMAVLSAGPRYDVVGKEGIAHLVEHLKTQNASDGDRSEIHGFTYFETVRYWSLSLPADLPKHIKELTKALNDRSYTSQAIEIEKKRVTAETNMIQTNLQKQIWELWTKLIFAKTLSEEGYAGSAKSISQIREKDVRGYISKFYVPSNLTFIIAGRISLSKEEIITLLKQTFSRKVLQKSFIPKLIKAEKNNPENQNSPSLIKYKDIQTAALICGFLTDGLDNKDYVCLLFMGQYLIRNGGGVLSKQLFSKQGIYSMNSSVIRLSDRGYFSVNFNCPPDVIEIILDTIYLELKSIINGKIDKVQFEDAKKCLVVKQITLHDNPEKIAIYYAQQYFLDQHSILTQEKMIEICKSINYSDLQKTAIKLFNPINFKLTAIGGIKNKLPLFRL